MAFAAAILGSTIPIAEQAERDRNAALATTELERISDTAESLYTANDPGVAPVQTIIIVQPPDPWLTNPGQFVIGNHTLRWKSGMDRNVSVSPPVPLYVATPIYLTSRTVLVLELHAGIADPYVTITRRANVQI